MIAAVAGKAPPPDLAHRVEHNGRRTHLRPAGVPALASQLVRAPLRDVPVLVDVRGGPGLILAQSIDPSEVTDPLIGRRPAGQDNSRGRALQAANEVCDLVHVRSNCAGTTVRVHTWL